MTQGTPGRRELVVGGTAGLALGALGLGAAPAQAAGIDTAAGLTAALDRYMATRAGVAGLVVRDNRNGRYFAWRPRAQQTHSAIKVLILITAAQGGPGPGCRPHHDAEVAGVEDDPLLRQRRHRCAPHPGHRPAVPDRGRPAGHAQTPWCSAAPPSGRAPGGGTPPRPPRDLVQLVNHLVLGTYISSGRRAYARDLMSG